MKSNVGKSDMIIRIIIGVVIASFGIAYRSWWGLISIIPIVTGLFRYCPLYTVFGSSTCPVEEEND